MAANRMSARQRKLLQAETCRKCRYFVPGDGGHYGECHVDPPQLHRHFSGELEWGYRETEASATCDDFDKKY